MNKPALFVFLLMTLFAGELIAQQPPVWDDTDKKHWPPEMELVEIPSSTDGAIQKAFLYRAKNKNPRPLIVSLHTWSGDTLRISTGVYLQTAR